MPLAKQEQETIINFNREDEQASIFTYDKTWQSHLEKKVGLKPVAVNSFGGRSYELPKSRIALPRKVRKATKAQLKGLEKARLIHNKTRKSPVSTTKIKRKGGKVEL